MKAKDAEGTLKLALSKAKIEGGAVRLSPTDS
jgi:hypothetical protein